MRRLFLVALPMLGVLGCAAVFGIPSDLHEGAASTDAGGVIPNDAAPPAPDASPASDGGGDSGGNFDGGCDPAAEFGQGVAIGVIDTETDGEADARLTDDELTIYFSATQQATGHATFDLYQASRTDRTSPFALPTLIAGSINTSGANEGSPNVSADGNTIVFIGGTGIVISTRSAPDATFDSVLPVTLDDGRNAYVTPFVREGHPETLWYGATNTAATQGFDIFGATAVDAGAFHATEQTKVSSGVDDMYPVVSADGLAIYVATVRAPDADGHRFFDIWMSRRASVSDAFGAPAILQSLAGLAKVDTVPNWISPDNCRLYFSRTTDENALNGDIFVATRPGG